MHLEVTKEIIIINDGSTDNSLKIATQYFERYDFISIVNQKNQGVSAARNVGIKLAKGKYLYFVDPDDYLLETDFNTMIQLADQYNAVLLKGTMRISYEDGTNRPTRVRSFENDKLQENQYVIQKGYQHLHDMLSKDWFATCWLGFFNTEFLRQQQLYFNEQLKLGEDGLFLTTFLTLNQNINVIEVGRVFYHYRLRPESATTTLNISMFTHLFDLNNLFIQLYQKRKQEIESNHKNANQILLDLQRIIAINYGSAYRFQYLRYTDDLKTQAKPYFTEKILGIMERFLPYPVKL